MNNSKCPLCSLDTVELITSKVRFDFNANVMYCGNCTLTFLDQTSFKYPDDFYKTQYHQTYLTHVEPSAVDPEKYFEKMLKTTKIWADKLRPILQGNEKVLDFGCSAGHFMSLIKNNVREIHGFDLNEKEILYCSEKIGLNASTVPVEKRFAPETFDVITMIFVLEHIGEPVSFLNYLKPFLKKNGKFIILIPCIQDPLVSFYDIPEFRGFYYCIEHLFYYNKKTIQILFEKAGLKAKVEVVQEYPVTNHLNWGYRQKPSDVLASRKLVPDIALRNESDMTEWESFWVNVNRQYLEFLSKNNYGDRLWCEVSF
ncbi:MAG: class I SAM-dependent methyltransferase [Spirochaetia bacterium]|nr:class I SAM-dependent methyltransferase [Spirochaetia bacterium]